MTTFADTGLRYTTPLTIGSQERVLRSDSLSLKTQVVTSGAQRWTIEAGLEATSQGGAQQGSVKLAVHRSRNGQHSSFTTSMPQHLGTTASVANSMVSTVAPPVFSLTSNYNAGDVVRTEYTEPFLVLARTTNRPTTDRAFFRPLPPGSRLRGSGSIFLIGDIEHTSHIGRFITFQGHSKVYQITKDYRYHNNTKRALMSFFPRLITDVANNAVINYNPDIEAYYAADGTNGLQYTNGILQTASISLIERV